MLEEAKAPAAVYFIRLIADGITQCALLPAQRGPAVTYQAMDFVGASERRPVNRSVLEVVVAANAVWGPGLIRHGVTQNAGLPAQSRPLADNRAVDFIG